MKFLFLLITSTALAGPSHLTIKYSRAIPENLCGFLQGTPEEVTIQPWEIRARSGDLLTITCEPTPKKSKNTQVSVIFKIENLGPGAHGYQFPWGKSSTGDKAEFSDTKSCQKIQKILNKVAKAPAVFFESEIESSDFTTECTEDKKWGTVLNFDLQIVGKGR